MIIGSYKYDIHAVGINAPVKLTRQDAWQIWLPEHTALTFMLFENPTDTTVSVTVAGQDSLIDLITGTYKNDIKRKGSWSAVLKLLIAEESNWIAPTICAF